MSETRRDFLRLGAGVAAVAATMSGPAIAAPPGNSDHPRLLSFRRGQAAPVVGALTASGRICDLGAAAKKAGRKLSFDAGSMVSLIAAGPRALDDVRALLAKATDADTLALSDVRLTSPLPSPTRNIYAVGWNYLEHFEEGAALRGPGGAEPPEHPVFFTKAVGTMNGPFDPIPYDAKVSTMIDWECELAVIIGKKGRNIAEANAMEHVFGFCVINDTTARDIQQKKHGGQWFKGKSLDGHGPMGPWIVPAAAVDYDNLHLLTRVNGVVKQDYSTKAMYFKVPRIVSELSLGLELVPGDVIATGTPPGIGYARKPPEFLKPGDVMESEIVGLGTLRNEIKAV